MIMELPPYQPPRLGEILRQMIERGWMFLKNASTIILGISIVLWFLTTYPKHPNPDAVTDRADRPALPGRPATSSSR
jgi:ferrous iron transport protein B